MTWTDNSKFFILFKISLLNVFNIYFSQNTEIVSSGFIHALYTFITWLWLFIVENIPNDKNEHWDPSLSGFYYTL